VAAHANIGVIYDGGSARMELRPPFAHGCRCKYLPRTNTEFWRNKIATNGAGTGEYRKRYGVKEGLSHELRNAPCINRQPSGGSQRRF
jgi:hypothetical protein